MMLFITTLINTYSQCKSAHHWLLDLMIASFVETNQLLQARELIYNCDIASCYYILALLVLLEMSGSTEISHESVWLSYR